MAKKKITKTQKKRGETRAKYFTPTKDTDAYAYDPETGEKLKETSFKSAPVEEETGSPVHMKMGVRIALIASIFLFAAMVVYVLSGYAKIAKAYAAINDLNSSIDELNIKINALNASIECAVTIEDAQRYAETHGMQYPTQNQYVSEGQMIPATGTGSYSGGISGSFPSGSTGDTSSTEGD